MSHPRSPIQSPERLREQAIAALVPFFLDGAGNDVKSARLVITGLLDDYHTATPRELQLSAQIVALSWAAIACLRTGVAAKNLSTDQVLNLQDSAIALDRMCQKATRALDARQAERARHPLTMTADNTQWDEEAFQRVIDQALDKMKDANVKLAAYMATLAPVKTQARLSILSAEPMTPAVLARRASH